MVDVPSGGTAFDPAAPGVIGGTTPDAVNVTELIVKDSGGTTTASIDGTDGSASFANGGLAIDQWGNVTSNSGASVVVGYVTAVTLLEVGMGGAGAGTLNVKDSSGITKASINGADGSASFANGLLTITQYGDLISDSEVRADIGMTIGGNGDAGTLNVKDSSGTTKASIDGSDGSITFGGANNAQLTSYGGLNAPGGVATAAATVDATLEVGANSQAGTLNVKDSGGNTKASIAGSDGSASFASGYVTIDQSGNLTSHSDIYVDFGVVIGGVVGPGTLTIKDSGGTTTASIDGSDGTASFASGSCAIDADGTLTLAGALIGGTQALVTSGGAGAVNLTTLTTEVETTGTLDALTLANGTVGQIKVITHTVGAFTSVLTPTTALGFTSITFLASLGQTCTLEYTTAGWVILSVGGLTLPVVA